MVCLSGRPNDPPMRVGGCPRQPAVTGQRRRKRRDFFAVAVGVVHADSRRAIVSARIPARIERLPIVWNGLIDFAEDKITSRVVASWHVVAVGERRHPSARS